jgi:asparagine synthase (glutamine-hydrolysing)
LKTRTNGPQAELLADSFCPPGNSTAIAWGGDGIAAFSFQPKVDAFSKSDEISLQIPSIGSYQGITHGWFFQPTAAMPLVVGSDNSPETVSHKLMSDFEDQGIAAFAHLNGGWAAVIWDRAQRRAVFARDAVGFETLYLAVRESQIFFASDLRILYRAGLVSEYDEQSVIEFLHFLFLPGPHAIYSNVCALLPGHALVVDDSGMRQERFAPRRFVRGVSLGDGHEAHLAVQEFLPRFEERLMAAAADCVPKRGRVGLLLSAGKDSPALAIALKEVAPDRVVALTVASPNPRSDESGYAARMCKFLGIPHQVYKPNPENLISSFYRMVANQEQPMGDPASLSIFLGVSGFPEDVSVIWDGSGNDDYFGVVHRDYSYRMYARRRRLRRVMPNFAWSLFLWAMERGPQRYASIAQKWRKQLEHSLRNWPGWTQAELEALWQRDIAWSENYLSEMVHRHADDWVALQTLAIAPVYHADAVIRKITNAGQATGLPVRLPFIDNRLVTFVNSLPQELKYQGETNKVLLRAYLAKHLPDDLIRKRKGYFTSFHQSLLRNREGFLLDFLKEAQLLRVFPSWSESCIDTMLSAYYEQPNAYVLKMYALSLLSLWMAIERGHIRLSDVCAF